MHYPSTSSSGQVDENRGKVNGNYGSSAMLNQGPVQAISTRFFRPSAELAPHISSYYLIDVAIDHGDSITDWLHPEWGNVRFSDNGHWNIGVDGTFKPLPLAVGTGPTSHTIAFRVDGPIRIWGVGLLPLGWMRLVGVPANALADTTIECTASSPYARLAGLRAATFRKKHDPLAEAGRIDKYLCKMICTNPPHEDEVRIRNIHTALFDEHVTTVAELAARIGLSPRSLERICLRSFGFPPKLLLRRQRFLRSLAQFLLNPSLSWIETLDENYVDQAHFVRDFKKFMQMSPSAYAAQEHPVLASASRTRTIIAGAPVQALHPPDKEGLPSSDGSCSAYE